MHFLLINRTVFFVSPSISFSRTMPELYKIDRNRRAVGSTTTTYTHFEGLLMALLIGVLVGVELNCSFSLERTSEIDHADHFSLISTWQRTRTHVSSSESEYNYSLAYEQSNGFFFQSITNQEWKLRQQAVRNATFHRYVDHPRRHWEKPNLWYYNNYDPIFSCPMTKRVRGIGDGPKWTCDPHQLKRIAYARKEANAPPCLLYSIGSNGNYQWEDGMYEETDGLCEIHVFDYSQNYTRHKNSGRNIHFHQWGLHGTRKPQRGALWKTMPEIIAALGHQDRVIDILKIDCEGCEWDTFQDWIDLDIRQILIETHSLPQNKSLGLNFFDAFLQNHFVMFSKEVNPWGGGECVEFSYIKLQSNFFKDATENVYQ